MTVDGLTYAAMLAGAVVLDALVRPRATGILRHAGALWLLFGMMTALFGLFMALCGNVPVSAALALAVLALLLQASNAKHAMLGEPLLFSDFALIGAVFSHPQFYLSAITIRQRVAAGIGAVGLCAALAWLFVSAIAPHLAGVALLLGSLVLLALSLRYTRLGKLVGKPDTYADVRRLGLLPSLLLYWLDWRKSCDPAPCAGIERAPVEGGLEIAPQLLVVIQCESFADPAELFGDPDLALPGLSFARENAWQWGRLEVSGFGAYTMRTEYGVLFGRDEEELGFRRYDPFLTALGEASYALPARLAKDAGWLSRFIHPHDMRFYGRDRIMPAAGFAELVGEDRFAPPEPGEGRYVTDAAMADEIMELAKAAGQPTMLYAVTIENHGPWAPDPTSGRADIVQSYLRLARNSDAMLTTLIKRLAALARDTARPAMLVFFGDHRPSIPKVTAPEGGRHTPYVMLRIDASGSIRCGENRRADLTPAGLHHAILDSVLGPRREDSASPSDGAEPGSEPVHSECFDVSRASA